MPVNVTCSPHIGRQLIDFVKSAVHHLANEIGIAQVADHKSLLSLSLKRGKCRIDTTHPKAVAPSSSDKVVANEAPCPAHDCRLHCLPPSVFSAQLTMASC